MNSIIKFISFLAISISFSAQSALVLNGTRFIYPEHARAIGISVTNYADTPFGGQLWIENIDGSDNIPFAVTPSIFSIRSNKSEQMVQVAKLDTESLKKDRETLFSVYLQELPPKPKDELGANLLVMAARIVVKLIYRPESIAEGRENAEEKIKISVNGKNVTFENPTPYYFAIISINGNKNLATNEFSKMAPFSTSTSILSDTKQDVVTFQAIDDYGSVNNYHCNLEKVKKQCQLVN
ncbi:fimbria/pilus periplasmic chaperone [Vibrio owensii]|uniref:fimbria/pilus periplasmic chaperone n=1 Tax=Vibrio owensii TaxID=696485 RepID=UPI00068CEF94|nr:fimbria/pilus periplasmic chaperone [Vibrio owensii]